MYITADAAGLCLFPRVYVFMSVHQASWEISYQCLGGQLMPYGCSTILQARQIPRPKRPTLSACIDNECNISLKPVVRKKGVQNQVDRQYLPTTLFAAKMSAII